MPSGPCCHTWSGYSPAHTPTRYMEEVEMAVQAYAVTGMTCEHCVHAVSSEIGALPGVTDVAVELDAGAASTVQVTSDAPLTDEQIAAALDEAGDYRLAS